MVCPGIKVQILDAADDDEDEGGTYQVLSGKSVSPGGRGRGWGS